MNKVLIALLPFFLLGCPKGNGGAKENTVIIWHWMTDREEAFTELAAKYKEQTGVDVQFQLYAPSEAYTQKVQVGAQTNSLPEIYGVLGEPRMLASFIKAGHMANLNADLGSGPGSWKETFYEEALITTHIGEGNRFEVEPGYYGIPIDVTTIPMIYNKKLFKKAGLNPERPPRTWDEFIEAGKALRKIGVSGFVSGWGETWLIFSLATDLAHNLMGADKVMDTFRGKVPYTDSQWVEVFAAFEKLQKAGFADPSLVSLENKKSEQSFASERSGITFNGSWAVNVYAGMNPNLDYAPFRPPLLNPKNPSPVWGGAGTVLRVNPNSPNKQLAIDFLKWFTSKESAGFLLEKTRNLPTVKNAGGNVSPVLQKFAALMQNSIHPNRFAVSEDPRVNEVFTKGIQSILIAEKSPKEIAEEVQDMKSRVLAEKKS